MNRLNVNITGEIVIELEAVFAMDWYTETGERLGAQLQPTTNPGDGGVPMQLLPSGPGYPTMPNLRLFTGLVHRAQQKLSLTSPYFVPEDSCWKRSPALLIGVSQSNCSYPSKPTSLSSGMLRRLITTSC
jgi:phosphatidylserine/phosphatidylglycerophosphate/cardiolipin synthase-like enzyme